MRKARIQIPSGFMTIIIILSTIGCKIKNSEDDGSSLRQLSNETPEDLMKKDFYLSKVQPIFDKRCVTCHACMESPCSLNLTSYEFLKRGAAKIDAANWDKPTRLKDGSSASYWSHLGFHSVDEKIQDKENIICQLTKLGHSQNTPGNFSSIDPESYDKRFCPNNNELSDYITNNPHRGMPLGLPPLSTENLSILSQWAGNGSQGPIEGIAARIMPSTLAKSQLSLWEDFLNTPTTKGRITARYIYEHSYLAHIHFEGTSDNEFYELIRVNKILTAREPEFIRRFELVTPRPNDSPSNGEGITYRFARVTETISKKTHILWELNHENLARWKASFLETTWSEGVQIGNENQLNEIDYTIKNPLKTFSQIPKKIRYQFLLDNAYLIINSMIKGPVCVGKAATYAIQDDFWVMFIDPKFDASVINYDKIKEGVDDLGKDKAATEIDLSNDMIGGYNVQKLWRGDETNSSALLTIFRHDSSVSVHKGYLGVEPTSAWLFNYSNLERIYYNLVVDYLPWQGNLDHLDIFKKMLQHRHEAENRFLFLLPKTSGKKIKHDWNMGSVAIKSRTEIIYNDIGEIFNVYTKLLAPIVKDNIFEIDQNTSDGFERELRNLTARQSSENDIQFANFLPNLMLLKFGERAYTIILNKTYSMDGYIFNALGGHNQSPLRTVSFLKGVVGDRINLILNITEQNSMQFLKDLKGIRTEENWNSFKRVYAISRSSTNFWNIFDWFHNYDKAQKPLEAGVLDLNYYDRDAW